MSGHAALAERIRAVKTAVAEEVTDEFFARHPDWVARYGPRGRRLGIEDAAFHSEFLAAAVELGSPDAYGDYAQWCALMLGARGIAPRFVEENIDQVAAALGARLGDEAREVMREFIAAGIAGARDPSPRGPVTEGVAHALHLAQRAFLQAAVSGERLAAATIVQEALAAGSAAEDLYLQVFERSMIEVGRLWEGNRISVAQEHMATAIIQYAMALVYPRIPLAAAPRGRVVVTGVEGELHQVGAQMVADMLESDGWDVRFLGTNTPHAAVARTVQEVGAEAVCISSAILANVPATARLIADLRAQAKGPRIFVGGCIFRSSPDLWRRIGADGSAPDVRGACELVGRKGAAPGQA